MYEIIAKKRIKKKIESYIAQYKDIPEKLKRLQKNPRNACKAHPLHGDLKGKWSCWLRSNIRIIYTINDEKKLIIVFSIGTHKIY